MAKLLDFMVRCNTATADDIMDDLIRMADPNSFDSRDELSYHLEDCLGYDPLVYFDRKTIEEQFDEIFRSAPFSVQDQLSAKKEEIIQRTLEYAQDIDESVLRKIFISVIKDTLGWQPLDDEVSLDECVSMAVFGDNLEDEEESDEDDEDDDDELSFFDEEDDEIYEDE